MRGTSGPPSDSTATLQLEFEGYELLVTGDGTTWSVPLPSRGELLIGRSDEADLRLSSNSVSRRHALLRVCGGELSLEELGSANGTLIRGERAPAHRAVPITIGDSLLIGEFVLTLRLRRSVVPAVQEWRSEGGPLAQSPSFVFRSSAMIALHKQTDPVARAKINVLILGETGVGKDVLARSIHERSDRRDKPFLRLNCAALSEPLLESELFGHEKGAFTGAAQAKPGLLVVASGGTVFLDEVGELPPRLQPKLLQVLETQEILSVGSVKARPIDVRFIAATNRDLADEAATGEFRSDLYYRLAAFTAVIPPLRERMEDVVPLAEEFLRRAAEKHRLGLTLAISEAAKARLLEHSWPGNVRELRNVIERAVVLCEAGLIGPEHLFLGEPGASAAAARRSAAANEVIAELPVADLNPREQEERQRILDALAACAGNQSKAAEKLGISRSTLLNRLDAYRISRPRKRPR